MMRGGIDTRGFTLIELLIVISVIAIITATATPSLIRARVSADEASAIGGIRAVISAQQDFNALTRGYAADLDTLGNACPGVSIAFISSDLSANGAMKSGYLFNVVAGRGASTGPNDCFGNPTQTAFYATAVPVVAGFTGSRGFAGNSSATIWQDTTGAAPTEPFTIGPTVTPIGQ